MTISKPEIIKQYIADYFNRSNDPFKKKLTKYLLKMPELKFVSLAEKSFNCKFEAVRRNLYTMT